MQDEVLRRAHQEHRDDDGKWETIAGYFRNRKSKQCFNRWFHVLNPAIKRAKQGGSGSSSLEKDIEVNYKELVSESSLVIQVSIFAYTHSF